MEWNTLHTSGLFAKTFLTTQGCDSIITMDITIHNSLTTFEVQSACDEYLWNGNIYTSTGTYIDTFRLFMVVIASCT